MCILKDMVKLQESLPKIDLFDVLVDLYDSKIIPELIPYVEEGVVRPLKTKSFKEGDENAIYDGVLLVANGATTQSELERLLILDPNHIQDSSKTQVASASGLKQYLMDSSENGKRECSAYIFDSSRNEITKVKKFNNNFPYAKKPIKQRFMDFMARFGELAPVGHMGMYLSPLSLSTLVTDATRNKTSVVHRQSADLVPEDVLYHGQSSPREEIEEEIGSKTDLAAQIPQALPHLKTYVIKRTAYGSFLAGQIMQFGKDGLEKSYFVDRELLDDGTMNLVGVVREYNMQNGKVREISNKRSFIANISQNNTQAYESAPLEALAFAK